MQFYIILLLLLILSVGLIFFGYCLGRSDGLMQGRRDLSDHALSLGDDFK